MAHISPTASLPARKRRQLRSVWRAPDAQHAIFAAGDDPETGFRLFSPRVAPPAKADKTVAAHLLRLAPNENLAPALAAYCASHGIAHGRIVSGVGSTIGARFADGRDITRVATEVFIKRGIVHAGRADKEAGEIDVGLVDYSGAFAEGLLAPGDNPVLATFEIVLVAES